MKKYKEVRTNEDNNKRVKRSIILMSILILIGITIFIGTSYALFSIMVEGKKKVSLETEEFKVDMEDGEYIKVDALGTMSDEEGKMSKPYTFTVTKNAGTIGAYYSLYLTEESGELNTYYLKYELKGTDGSIKEGRIGTLDQFYWSKYLEAGSSVTYELRLWLDKDTPNSEQGNSYQSKVALEGSQIAKEGTVIFTYNGKEYNEKSDNNTVTIPLDLDSDENAKVLVCNNEAIPSYEDKTLTIKNITKETSCKVLSSLFEVSTQMDDTYNNIVLIKDENRETVNMSFSSKKGNIDLNGHVVNLSSQNSGGTVMYLTDNSDITIGSSKDHGGIVVSVNSSEWIGASIFYVVKNAKLTVTSGYYYSNAPDAPWSTFQVSDNKSPQRAILNLMGKKADNCTSNIEDYHSGLCIYNEIGGAVKHNASSYNGVVNIYGGSLVSKKSAAYSTDAPGGETNIYGGYFNGATSSVAVGADNSEQIIRICDGEFVSTTDIIVTFNTIPIYYRNGIKWKNGTTPTINGIKNNVQLKPDLNCKY